MRILFITTMYPNPKFKQNGIFCHEQVKALINLGYDVDVIVPIPFYNRDVQIKYWIYEGVRIRYIRYIKLPGTRLFEKIGDYFYLSLCLSNIQWNNYDVIHTDCPLPAGEAARRISQKYNIPYIVHGHGLDVFLEKSYLDAKNCREISSICKTVYNNANAIVGVSEKVVNLINTDCDVKEKSYVVYNGVDNSLFFPIDKKNEVFTILTVGNLIDIKGHEYTIRAFHSIVKNTTNKARLIIAGRGPNEKILKNLVRELGLTSQVEFLGYVPYFEIADIMKHSDLFVLPAYYEALGCVYLEAMATGIPTIGCYQNGIDEIIQDNINGFLVQPHEVKGLISIMEKCIKNNDLSRKIGENAVYSITTKYTWHHSAKELVKIYKKVLREG